MTNMQLLLSIGIPSLLVILSWISNNTRLANLEQRLDAGTNRLDGRINALSDRLDRQIDSLQARMDQRFDYLVDATVKLHERVATVEAKQS